MWSEAELRKASDLVVIGRPIKVKALAETNSLGWVGTEQFQPRFRGVETTFKVLDVVQGMPANDEIVVHHYRFETKWGSPPNGPIFVAFSPDSTNRFMLYLARERAGTNRYDPVTGQVDPGDSFKPPPTNNFPGFPTLPPIADTDATVRHAVQVHVPVRLHAKRQQRSILIKTDELGLTNLTVGRNMVTGTECGTQVYQGDKLVMDGSSSLQGGLADGGYDSRIDGDLFKLPQPGESCTVVVKVTLFETDEPTQHFWSPRSGNKYKVLWEETFRLEVTK